MQARKYRSQFLATGVAAAMAMLSLDIHAQTSTFYAVGDVGASRYKVSVVQDSIRTIGGVVDTNGSANGTATGIALGWQATPWLGLELGYADFGKINLTGRGAIPCQPAPTCVSVIANLSGDFKAKTTHVSAIASMPISDEFSIFGRIGVARTEKLTSVTIVSFTGKNNANKTEAIFGLGASYAFTKTVEGVVEWKNLADSKVNATTLGIRVRF